MNSSVRSLRPDQDRQENVVTFHQIYPAATPPMRADKSALGTIPTVTYQYCEAVRTASAFGWYVFPPTEIRLIFDGSEVLYADGNDWRVLTSIHLEDEFLDYWDSHAPADQEGRAPPYLSHLLVPGIVQIWSGFLISSAEDWSILVRSPANLHQSRKFVCYDGIIETDRFKPCPLFINIRLLSTDVEIVIPTNKPLFQVQPLRRECYADAVLDSDRLKSFVPNPDDDDDDGMTEADWDGYRKTTRSVDPADTTHKAGSYGVNVRRRGKRE